MALASYRSSRGVIYDKRGFINNLSRYKLLASWRTDCDEREFGRLVDGVEHFSRNKVIHLGGAFEQQRVADDDLKSGLCEPQTTLRTQRARRDPTNRLFHLFALSFDAFAVSGID